MLSRYDVMPAAPQQDARGSPYPDPMLFPWDKLTLSYPVKKYRVTQNDLDRFDVTCHTEYGAWAYDDLVLWFNGILDIHAVLPGTTLSFPDKRDLDLFLSKNRV